MAYTDNKDISKRETILASLKAEMEEYMTPGDSDYRVGIYEAIRGIQLYEDCPNKPCCTIWGYKDEMEDEKFSGSYIRNLFIKIYGYCDGDGYSFDEIHKLARDIEYFLENDWTYKDSVYLGDMIIYEGGATDPAQILELDIMVRYHTTISDP